MEIHNNNSENLISIVVPIYNVEKYLHRCVDSLLNQTYGNYEIILVDDGSTDDSLEICDEYRLKDKRVQVIHQDNGGLSRARNSGIKIAKGEYIAFVDSDDWVSEYYLETLINTARNTGADIVECEIMRTSGVENSISGHSAVYISYSTVEALRLLIEDNVFHQYVWNKLYRRDLMADLYFPHGKTNEDEFWTYRIFANAQKIVKTNSVLYYYFQRNDSIMGTTYSVKRLDALEAKIQRMEYIEKHFPEYDLVAFWNGSCGDMSTRFTRQASNFEELERYGDLISKQVKEIMNQDVLTHCDVQIELENTIITLPVKKVESIEKVKESVEKARKDYQDAIEKGLTGNELRLVLSILEGCENNLKSTQAFASIKEINMPVKALKLPNMTVIFTTTELFSILSNPMKKYQLEFVGYANGYQGYLPDKSAYELNYYEASSTPYALGAGELLMEEILKWQKK